MKVADILRQLADQLDGSANPAEADPRLQNRPELETVVISGQEPVADLPKYQTTMTEIERATGMRFNLGQ